MEQDARHLRMAELVAGLDDIGRSPEDAGAVRLIVRRPAVDRREVLEEGVLDAATGLVGDTWSERGSARSQDGGPHPDMQLNIMNARAIALIAGPIERWPLAGDQLYIDLDLSGENLPAGSRLSIGSAIVQVTDMPHTGCDKFVARFGLDAMRFVNSPTGRRLNLRGINARVVQPGVVRTGDRVQKQPPAATAKARR